MNTALSCLSFRDVSFDVVDRNGQPWLRSQQISVALGYSRGDQVNDLYERNADEFTEAMTALVKLPTKGGAQEVRIFSLRGCHLLGMFARTKPAKEFRKWVLDVLEQHSAQAQPQPQPQPKQRVIKSRDDLSFTRRDSEGRLRNWVVPHIPGSDWHDNVKLGRQYFCEILELAHHNVNEARDAMKYALIEFASTKSSSGYWGVECGFAECIALALWVGWPTNISAVRQDVAQLP